MLKKAKGHSHLVHPSFPAEGTVQPAHMGSQSQVPLEQQLAGPMAPQMPGDNATSMAPQGE